MVFLAALLIFTAASAAAWFTSVALYDWLLGEPGLRQKPEFAATSAMTVGLTALWSFAPFQVSFPMSLLIYALAVWSGLGLTWARGSLLFVLLAVVSFVLRLAIAGAANY